MNEFWKMKFLFCFLLFIIDLKNHLADCFVEHSGFNQLKISFEMEMFKDFEKMYKKCLKKYRRYPDGYIVILDRVMEPIKEYFNEMEQVTNDIKLEIMCDQIIYEDMKVNDNGRELAISWAVHVVALKYSYEFLLAHFYHRSLGNEEESQLFANCAAYLAAFGANLSNRYIYVYELIRYIRINNEANEPSETNQGDCLLPYAYWMESTRNGLFKTYNKENKYFDIQDKEFRGPITTIEMPTRQFDFYLADIMFATNPLWPGSATVPTENYVYEKLWAWPDFIHAIKNIEFPKTSDSGSNIDELPSQSLVIQILRETEIQKIKFNRFEQKKEDMTDEEIENIKNGFTDESDFLNVLLIKTKYSEDPTLLFTKSRKGTYDNYLATGENYEILYEEFKWICCKNLKAQKPQF